MIGIDLTKISRFKDAKKTFIEKMLHPDEIVELEKSINQELFLAERWAIKEALFKANNDFFHFNKFALKLENRVFKFPGYIITTTKEDDYYVAVVIKESICK